MTSHLKLFDSVKNAEYYLEIIEDQILRDISADGQPQTIAAIVKKAADLHGEEAGHLIKFHLMYRKFYQ